RTDTATPSPSIKLPMVIRPRPIYAIRNLAPLSGPRPSNHNRGPLAMTVELFGIDNTKRAIKNYDFVVNSSSHWFTYRWSLWEFIVRGLSKFIDEADPLNNFKIKNSARDHFSEEYGEFMQEAVN
ncbi:MAG: hypothetical protein ACUZ8I_08340, partial [Candidatus Scalindua sp.]